MKSELEEEFQKWLKEREPWSAHFSSDIIAKYREIFYAGAQAQEATVSKMIVADT